jgi:hypothetical protein
MPHQYVLFLAHHLWPFKTTSIDDVIEVQAREEFKDANKSSSICKFTLFNSIQCLESLIGNFFFRLFLGALLLAMDGLVDFFSLQT